MQQEIQNDKSQQAKFFLQIQEILQISAVQKLSFTLTWLTVFKTAFPILSYSFLCRFPVCVFLQFFVLFVSVLML